MIVLQRTLIYSSPNGEMEVRVAVLPPSQGDTDWSCAYEIAWPDGPRRGYGYGVDATQAMLLALQAIGTDIYTSDYHRSGRLRWEQSGRGYGYPVPKTIRDLLVGDDAQAFG